MQENFNKSLVWFRRDLRCHDHAALYHALRHSSKVYCAFVFDTDILQSLPRSDRRVEFILRSVQELDASLRQLAQTQALPHAAQTGLIVLHGSARTVLPALAARLGVEAVFTNHDYEPAARDRDNHVRGQLAAQGISLRTFKDHVVFEHDEILTGGGTPYSVFTPYYRQWLARLTPWFLRSYPVDRHAGHLAAMPESLQQPAPSLEQLGFLPTNLSTLQIRTGTSGGMLQWEEFFHRMDHYDTTRDYPAIKGPSYLGVHLRFGTLSIREVARPAMQRHLQGDTGAGKWLSELAWRDFYIQLLAHYPHVVDHAFKPEYDDIRWDHSPHGKKLFAAWCGGLTGYPLVDAAMHQLHATGYMHNRLRMLAASFLTRQLGVDWRWGERHFAEHLNDYDLASNNGGWQWASGTGCDAQPWFRIFNPLTQSLRYDAQGKFIRRYLPALSGLPDETIHAPWKATPLELAAAGIQLGRDYPAPVVDLAEARDSALQRFRTKKQGG